MTKEKNIAGIATSGNNSSISVIRISGDKSKEVTSSIFRGVNGRKLDDILPFTLRYGHIVKDDEIIDEVIVSYFKGPKSYTGEDVIEISCHGGSLPVRKIIELLISKGVSLAQPGEFTKRAFLNGRIDLSQAEAVMDIINSQTEAALKSASDQSRGKLSQKITALRERLLNVMAKIEVTLDFPDDELERKSDIELRDQLIKIGEETKVLLDSADLGKIMKEGLKVVIAGRPNVGKSSLLNALLEENRAIVTDIPGTTRDVIEEFMNINGIPVRIKDTAGIRKTDDVVEKIGVEKSLSSIDDSDLVILVLDLSRELSSEDEELINKTNNLNRIILLNKSDLKRELILNEEIEKNAITISALNNYGLDEVKNEISKIIGNKSSVLGEVLVTTERHKEALMNCLKAINDSIDAINNYVPMDLVTIDINTAWQELGEITGDTLREDLVDKIFSDFCIGK